MHKANKKSGFLQDLNYVLALIHINSKIMLPVIIIKSLFSSSVPYINILFSYVILNELLTQKNKQTLFAYVIWMLITNLVIGIIIKCLEKYCDVIKTKVNLTIDARIADKSLRLDYEQLESKENMELLQIAKEGANSNGGIFYFCENFAGAVNEIASIIYSIILLIPLFTQVKTIAPSMVHRFFASPWSTGILFLLYALSILINFIIINRMNKKAYFYFQKNVENNRVFSYFMGQLLSNYNFGKDFRIYDMHDMIMKEASKANQAACSTMKQVSVMNARTYGICSCVDSIILFLSYAFVGTKAILGYINVASVLKFVTILTTLSSSFKSLTGRYAFLSIQVNYLKNYSAFMELPNFKYQGELPIEKRDDNEYDIEFRDVSFHYPNSDDMILNHVSLKLKIGQKLAIVGPNGAGKTTFIKLLCRLYDPTDGEILLNGVNIAKYDYQEYLRIFSVVFQDFKLFSLNIAQNVAANTTFEENTIWDALEKAGIKERVEKLDSTIQTVLYQSDENGVEISGGEAQKIAIARALYKDAPIVILDEPTSALDPISEYEIYSKFDTLVHDKTSIYISHRMASCRFCDNIIVFDKGAIVQIGNHDVLLQENNGLYHKLWNAQAQYYTA